MDVRRRTLAAEGPAGNALPPSSLPMPPSAMKKPASRLGSARMSMIPQQVKPSQHLGVSQMSAQSQADVRRSTMMSSGGRGDGGIYGRTPQPGRSMPSSASARRSSVYTASASQGRPSMMPGAFMSSAVKDTRPIKNATFQQQSQRNILDFLALHRCPIGIPPKFFTSATTVQFQQLFKWLIVELIDPHVVFGKKFEDDVIAILRDLRYPAVDSISKTSLSSIGSAVHWPALQAMLNWLVDLCKAQDNWYDAEIVSDPLLMTASELPLDFPVLEERLQWDYFSKAFTIWFDDVEDDFPALKQEISDVYDKLTSKTIDENERLESEYTRKDIELRQLQAQVPALSGIEDEYNRLQEDKTKYITFLETISGKVEKLKRQRISLAEGVATTETRIQEVRKQLAETESTLAAQNLSPDEATKMMTDREGSQRQFDELTIKNAEASQAGHDLERNVSKHMDDLENLLEVYTALGLQIGIIKPGHTLDVGPGGIDYGIELDLNVVDLSDVQSTGLKMKTVLRPGLQTYGEGFRATTLEFENESIALADQIDRLSQKVTAKKEEAGTLEAKLNVVDSAADLEERQYESQSKGLKEQLATMEDAIAAVIVGTQQKFLTTQSELEAKKIEFQELQHQTASLQDTLVTQLMGHIDVIIKAKEHTANSLKGVRTFAEVQ
ncbi:kinetochore protein NDC80, partial [Tremellales sp. Uapishka_1]